MCLAGVRTFDSDQFYCKTLGVNESDHCVELVDPKATVLHGRLENNCNYLVQCPGSIARKLRADMFLGQLEEHRLLPHTLHVIPRVPLCVPGHSVQVQWVMRVTPKKC